MTAQTTVVPLTDGDAALWQAYVRQHPHACLYHDYRWRGVIGRVFRRETVYLAARDDQGIKGVLPLARLKSPFFGDFLVSLPYFNYGGVLGDRVAADSLLDAAVRHAAKLGVDHVEMRHSHDQFANLPSRTDKVAMWLPLPDDVDTLWRTLGTKIRAQIRRPTREGASSRVGGEELIDDFYSVFARNMRDLGTPVYPKQLFVDIARTFADSCTVHTVELEGRTVAAGFVLHHRDRFEIPWAASLREFNRLGVNMFLYAQVLEWCIGQGAKTFDFGRSTVDSGTFRFKRQWGAEPVPLYWHYWLPDGRQLPQLRPDNPKYAFLVKLWQRQPVALANLVGPLLVKNLP